MSARLLVLRHGQSEWNAQGRGHGWGDPPLSARGEQQARDAVPALRGAGLAPGVVSSDLQRSVRTATLLAEGLGLGAVETTAGLREHDIGEWDGLTWEQIEASSPGAREAWVTETLDQPPGGEHRSDFHARVLAAVRDVAACREGERTLVCAHGGVVRALERLAGIEPGAIAFVSGRWFTLADGTLHADDALVTTPPPETPAADSRI